VGKKGQESLRRPRIGSVTLVEVAAMSGAGLRRDGGQPREYCPPSTIEAVDAQRARITNGMLLRVPRLFCAGDVRLLDGPSVAIVGSRKATVEGQRRAAHLARVLVRDRVTVVSGLALGIDTAAHRAAIEAGGRTIAVIGTPLDKAYPKENVDLQETIYRDHLLVSPFQVGTKTPPSHFPERNRVMARLARATVIIEAGDTSGSLHQAAESLAVGHPVFISRSVIQDPKLKWPARFIGKPNVYELESASDVLDVLLR
jgi:DNA processing protein